MKFQGELLYEIVTYPVNCRLWKPMYKKLRLFCSYTDFNNAIRGQFNFLKTSFRYNNHIINIESDDYFQGYNSGYSKSFLYSDIQYIDLDSEEDIFNIKFKYDYLVRDDEAFILNRIPVSIPLDDYEDNKEEKEIIFSIKRNLIEQKINRLGHYQLLSMNEGWNTFDNVFDIVIRYNKPIEKEKIIIKIGLPERSSSKREENIAFKTESNVVPDITTDEFKMRFIDSNNVAKNYSCYLKKSYNKNFLYLFCSISNIGTFILENQKLIKEYIHYKYIFDIINENNSTSLNIVDEFGTGIVFINPNVFNYNFQEDIIIFISMTNNNKKEDILITPNEYATENETLLKFYPRSSLYFNTRKYYIPLSFFENKKSGYYYLYHPGISGESDYIPYYEANPIYLNLPPSNLIVIRIKESIVNYIGKNGIIYFITNYIDNIKNIFNEPDIENKITLNTTVYDENDFMYNVTCKIWNPKNEYIRIFCQLLEDLKETHQIALNNFSFSYNDYNITIISENHNEVHRESCNYTFPFLYSENQTIVLVEEKEQYELRFKIITYNNDILLLKFSDNFDVNYYITLDNCTEEGKELICTIEKNKLKEKLPLFKYLTLGYLTEVGIYEFNSVPKINIKYENMTEKEDIYLNITKLLRNSSDNSESIITYETNISSCPEIVTYFFALSFFIPSLDKNEYSILLQLKK